MSTGVTRDPWARFRAATRARIGLGRVGDGLPTRALLDFQLAHARARDAVHGAVDFDALAASLGPCAPAILAKNMDSPQFITCLPRRTVARASPRLKLV